MKTTQHMHMLITNNSLSIASIVCQFCYLSNLHTADTTFLQFQNNRAPSLFSFQCDGSLGRVTVEGDDPLEICVRISGSEGETVEANVIIVDGTATGMYVLAIADALELSLLICELNL